MRGKDDLRRALDQGLLVLPERGSGGVDLEGGVLRYDPELADDVRAPLVLEALDGERAYPPKTPLPCDPEHTLEQLAVGVVIVNDTRILWASERACEMLGRTLHEMRATDFWQWIHPDDLPSSVETVRRNDEDGIPPSDYVNRWVNPTGGYRRLRWTGSTRDSRGHYHCTVQLLAIEPAAVDSDVG